MGSRGSMSWEKKDNFLALEMSGAWTGQSALPASIPFPPHAFPTPSEALTGPEG